VPLIYGGVPVGELYLGFSEEAINGRERERAQTRNLLIPGSSGSWRARREGVGLPRASRPTRSCTHRGHRGRQFKTSRCRGLRDELGVMTDYSKGGAQSREKEMIKRASRATWRARWWRRS